MLKPWSLLLLLLGILSTSYSFANEVVLLRGPNDIRVTDIDVKSELSKHQRESRNQLLNDNTAIKQIIENIYIRKEAARRSISKYENDSDLRNKIESLKERALAEITFENATRENALSDEQAVKYATSIYRAEKERFIKPETPTYSQITIPIKNYDSILSTKYRMDQVLASIKSGAIFNDEAKKIGIEFGNATENGPIAITDFDSLSYTFRNEASKIKNINELSPVIIHDNTLKLITLTGSTKSDMESFESVKLKLTQEAKQIHEKEYRVSLVRSMLSETKGEDTNLSNLIEKLKKD